ncbi:hypothetical protein Jab_1c23920 [Janthinobacterium sp. HH01]|uniref:hypothetical protein n=1 Tax=Janthinobacterium sp. HH01 TaxID=1198452 RepID=UPI0002AE8AF9|nr:hypothetical protein [Janthinobacterium sp. HH01]ELX13754.1 hypothetical protein Jab_1c23920 [Janthinobacterium sp. HH01]
MNLTFRSIVLTLAAVTNFAMADEGVVFREPYTLRLHQDKTHYVEYPVGKVPFVLNGSVFLFKDDYFGIGLDVQNGAVAAVKYLPNPESADVSLRFTQSVKEDGSSMMLLEIVNRTKYTLMMNGVMVTPAGKGPVGTSIIPVQAGLVNFESWPHPIAQLVLTKLAVK